MVNIFVSWLGILMCATGHEHILRGPETRPQYTRKQTFVERVNQFR